MADSHPNPPTLPGGQDAPTDSPLIGPSTPTAMPDEEDAKAEMPLTMAASVVLTSLPQDATKALAKAGDVGVERVPVRFRAVGSAPALRQSVAKVGTTQRFETVVRFLRKRLGAKEHQSVFCYVNSVFAPGLDENVGNLWRCFKTKDELVISYSMAQAYG